MYYLQISTLVSLNILVASSGVQIQFKGKTTDPPQ